jgi:hypothetical protein
MKSILDSTFRYVPSFSTDLRKTFARIRRDQRRVAERVPLDTPIARVNVTLFDRKAAKVG